MNPGHDTFTRFLDVVIHGVDGSAANTADQAARLAISRSQLDRVVAEVAGEPPARLRRRILLERAAYRLMADGNATVLDVAIEAGYGSHAAFTRAFTDAFGATPSSWRRHPGLFRITSPNDVHFFPPGGLRLPASHQGAPMDLIVTMTEHHIWLLDEMLQRAANIRDSDLDKPIEISYDVIDDALTLRSLLSRLVGQLDMWNSSMADRPYDFSVEKHERIGSMRTRLAKCGPTFLTHVRDACGQGALEDTFVDATGGSPQFFTYGGMIAHVLTYGSYRRTLACAGLVAAGAPDLQDDPLAWEPVRPPGPSAP